MQLPLTTARVPARAGRWEAGALLVVAAALVGLAIAADGVAARTLNGLGGLCWLAAGVLLARSLRSTERWLLGMVATLATVVALTILDRPSDLASAVAGFAAGGLLVAALVRNHPVRWALLVPATWLPVHLLLAIGRAAVANGAGVRTEPPPTAALVPLGMVLAALVGGLVVAQLAGDRARSRKAVRASDES